MTTRVSLWLAAIVTIAVGQAWSGETAATAAPRLRPELGHDRATFSARAHVASRLQALGRRAASATQAAHAEASDASPAETDPQIEAESALHEGVEVDEAIEAAAVGGVAVVSDGGPGAAAAETKPAPSVLAHAADAEAMGGHDHESCTPRDGCQRVCCGPGPRGWATVDYLGWWVEGAETPPLITTSPLGTPLNQAGVLGQPGTTILFGDETIDENYRSGGRIRAGMWLDDCQTHGFAGEIFGLENASTNYIVNSNGNPILGRPFFDISTGQQNRQIDAYPGVVEGGKVIDSRSQLMGAGAMALCNLCRSCWCCSDTDCQGCTSTMSKSRRIDLQIGYRFLRLDEDFNFFESAVLTNPQALGAPVAAGTRLDVWDMFDVENQSHGGEIGLIFERRSGRWGFDINPRMALGNNRRVVTIPGFTQVSVPNLNPVVNQGGFLALPTNIGRFDDDEFSVIPQVYANLSYQVSKHVRARLGYNFLFWTDVVRAAEQIDPVINPTQFPLAGGLQGAARPEVAFNSSDIWIHGFNAGLEFTW